MSSACTCHINKEECSWCNKGINYLRNGELLHLRDEDGWIIELEKGKKLGIGVDAGCGGVDLEKHQIKELMLFLDKNYGYLLEGAK